jgi:hypothetical protein
LNMHVCCGVFVQLRNPVYTQFADTSINLGRSTTVNLTLDYTKLTVVGVPGQAGRAITYPFGFMVSADDEVSVFAVKSDQGTTDGYLVSVLTNNSKEFFIAGWP